MAVVDKIEEEDGVITVYFNTPYEVFDPDLDPDLDPDVDPEMEFKEFEPRFKSAKTRFKLSAGLNLETFDTILSGTNHI